MSRKKLIIISLGVVFVALYYVLDPTEHLVMPKCVFKALTGLNCPLCGGQRAIHAALHGQILDAARYNYFLAFSLPYALILIIENWLMPASPLQQKIKSIAEHRAVVITYVALFFVWFLVRNLLGV